MLGRSFSIQAIRGTHAIRIIQGPWLFYVSAMLTNFPLGTALIAATVAIHTLGLIVLSHPITRLVFWFRLHRHDFWRVLAMVATVLGLFVIHTTEASLWVVAYLRLRATKSFEEALYPSTASVLYPGRGERPLGPALAPPQWNRSTALS
jgi:hypothetical protein